MTRSPSGASPTPSPALPVLHALRRALASSGLRRVLPLRVGAYNRGEPESLRLPEPAGPDSLAVVVGNGRTLWDPFLRAVKADSHLRASSDPLDHWVAAHVHSAAAALDPVPTSVHFAHGPGSRSYSIQRAATASGAVFQAPCHLAIHPRLGLWFALRAVLVFDIQVPEPRSTSAPSSPCLRCPDQPCLPAMERALQPTDSGEAPAPGTVRERWRAWLAVRDACPVGRDHRYPERQVRYHYTGDRSLLPTD